MSTMTPNNASDFAGKNLSELELERPVEDILRDIAINSTVAYILSFLTVYGINYLANSLIAHYWEVSNTLFYYGADFKEYRGTWSRSSVVTIYGVGPTLCLFWALFCFRMYFRSYKKPGIGKVFYVWGVIHGFVMFFGAASIGVLTKSGFAYALRWANIPWAACFIIAALGFVVLLAVGLRFINYFMYTAPSLGILDDNENKQKFILSVVVLPYAISTVILLMLQAPEFVFANILLIMSPGLVVFPLWARVRSSHGSFGIAHETGFSANKVLLLTALAVVVAYRVFLSSGLKLMESKVQNQATQVQEIKPTK